jgi:hypothetical protein
MKAAQGRYRALGSHQEILRAKQNVIEIQTAVAYSQIERLNGAIETVSLVAELSRSATDRLMR